MTLTEDAPVVTTAPAEPPMAVAAPAGLASILGSGDHKVVGRLWLVAALIHLTLAGAAALWVAVLQTDLNKLASDPPDLYAQIFTFRSIGGAFLFLLPITVGLATIVVPLQVGAPTVAFPRAAAAAVWTYLLGGGLLIGSYAIDGGPFGDDTDGVRLFLVAFLLVLVALAVAWICIGTTVIALRAPGMSLRRVPLFAWSALIATTVWVFTLPVLAAVVLITYVDIRYGGAPGFIGGGAQAMYERIAWVFGTPTVYAFAIPVLGFAGSVVPVFASTRHHLHRVAMALIGAFGALAVGVWALPSFGGESTPWLYELPWVTVSFAALVPVLGLVGLWMLTLRRGRVRPASPLLFAGSAAALLLIGVVGGANQSIEPLKTFVDGEGSSLYGTTVSTAVTSSVVLAAAVAALGGFVFWAPKILGRQFPEGGARLVALLLLAGSLLWTLPAAVAGFLGQPASIGATVEDNLRAIEALDVAAAVGGALLALGGALFVSLVVRTVRSGEPSPDDPWEGHSLEWATASPPPAGNFAALPEITSEAPLYDARHQAAEAEG